MTTCSTGGSGNSLFLADFTATSDTVALFTVNVDLWTQRDGYNEDIGIFVNGLLIAWKESGGARAYSPNAATLQVEYPVNIGTSYHVEVEWKSNRAAPSGATIYAGAGPINGQYSPSHLSVVLLPAPLAPARSVSAFQYQLAGSDGATWEPMTCNGATVCSGSHGAWLSATLTPKTDGIAELGFNTDLWTDTPGYNQDIGIFVNGKLAGWKESGGSTTFSPNAAFLQVEYPVSAGQTYSVDVRWKANRPDNGTIAAGAGPIYGDYSPSILTTALLYPGVDTFSSVSSRQFSLQGSDGATWQPLTCAGVVTCSSGGHGNAMSLTVTPTQNCTVTLTGNADLWTDTPGYNQDLGIFVNGSLAGWKESGAMAGGFSPNAAYVDVAETFAAGTTYNVDLRLKSNIGSTGVTIYAGGGPIGGSFSPTLLGADFRSCL